jgi:hypothetical protein
MHRPIEWNRDPPNKLTYLQQADLKKGAKNIHTYIEDKTASLINGDGKSIYPYVAYVEN